ncbi:PAS/PAC sensor signal transduction histidine kinase [Algoriphagus faecimaris]|uniref:histidine kinase n=1 Tax=Algoriphagus faecimaris TaxID=686796 RepID=A0A1G6S2L4_9BACT|nr:histidine kinase N-terminal 7TM domain-containing protein [Algoriphagus faecimaris]SDD11140.1 PAS/PAC sensor signal transduction histidine kinase [Algoriphagus faecimaris]
MELELNFFSSILIFTSIVVVGLSSFLAIKLNDSTRWISLTMIFVSTWSFFYGLELSSKSLEDMLFWIKLEYLGISFTPAIWVIFTLRYTGYPGWRKSWIFILTFVIPIITFFLVLTNESHQLHYADTWVIASGPFPVLGIEIGPWYLVHTIYSYIAFLLGTVILWKRFQFADPLFKTQTKFIIAAGIFPLVFNLIYQLGIIKPYEGIDLTPYAFIFTYLVMGFAILRYNLFSIKPIAHTKIMASIPRGVLVFDAKNKVVDFNPASRKFCAVPEKIKIGALATDIFKEKEEILQLITKGVQNTITITSTKASNSLIIKIEMIPILDKKSILGGTILLFEDITIATQVNQQLRDQAQDLKQLNELKDKFFSIISHDLKGPIFGVKELINMTEQGLISKDEFMEMLPEVSKNMEQVSILLENLLAWASSQLRGEFVEAVAFDLYPLLENQKKLLTRIAEENKIKITIQSHEKHRIFADKNMVDLIIRNLISNAIKFSQRDSEIKISTSLSEDTIKIDIQDSGAGIDAQNLKKLKEGISFTTRGIHNESGTGLGLVLVRDYLKKNNGKLEVKSQKEVGTTFSVYLPSA